MTPTTFPTPVVIEYIGTDGVTVSILGDYKVVRIGETLLVPPMVLTPDQQDTPAPYLWQCPHCASTQPLVKVQADCAHPFHNQHDELLQDTPAPTPKKEEPCYSASSLESPSSSLFGASSTADPTPDTPASVEAAWGVLPTEYYYTFGGEESLGWLIRDHEGNIIAIVPDLDDAQRIASLTAEIAELREQAAKYTAIANRNRESMRRKRAAAHAATEGEK
jgi:hypothetical protein